MITGDLLSNATIHTIVPCVSEIDFESVLSQNSSPPERNTGNSAWPFANIQQRDLLFFDELAPVYVILQLVDCADVALKSQLSNVSVKLDVFAANAADPNSNTESNVLSTKELIFSGAVQDADDPLVIVQALDSDEYTHTHVFVIWKSEAYLHRPRTRLQQPHVAFTASAAFGPAKRVRPLPDDEYIPSLTPASVNVFQPLVGCSSPTRAQPYLPASRLLRVAPAAKTDERNHNISQSSLRFIRIVPIATSRIRYSRLNTYSTRSVVMANLDFEVTPFTNLEVNLESLDLSFLGGTVENLGPSDESKLPILCRARDDVTFVFKLIPDEGGHHSSSKTALVAMLDISIRASVRLSKAYQPKISMQWTTNVDFSLPLNPTFGGPSQVLQRNNRPTSLPMTPNDIAPIEPLHPLYRKTSSFADLGVAVTLSAPTYVEVGRQFDWDVFVVNRSDRVRRFAMIVTPTNKEPLGQKHTPQKLSFALPRNTEDDVAHAVVDENVLFTTAQKLITSYEIVLLCLTPDVTFGPLLPGACHSLQLPMLPLSPGPLHVAAIKFVDLDTNEAMEIRDLPDVTASLARS